MPLCAGNTGKAGCCEIRVMIHNHAKTSPWRDPEFMAAKVAACSSYVGASADIGHWPAASAIST